MLFAIPLFRWIIFIVKNHVSPCQKRKSSNKNLLDYSHFAIYSASKWKKVV